MSALERMAKLAANTSMYLRKKENYQSETYTEIIETFVNILAFVCWMCSACVPLHEKVTKKTCKNFTIKSKDHVYLLYIIISQVS